jgi:hypothetical protein
MIIAFEFSENFNELILKPLLSYSKKFGLIFDFIWISQH